MATVAQMAERARRFFAANRKGENFELKSELNHEERWRRKEAVKKVIANMTIGKDVSSLFADVVKNMQTEDLELKKLVYLYLTNYAKSQPELVILAINTFVKDSDDPNPLIRALAIRTMGCLRVEKVLDYFLEPLKKALKDDHPYVRKTAAICIAKIFDFAPTVCVEEGMINTLQDMLSDANPMVVANAVAALSDIAATAHRKEVFTITNIVLSKLLSALNECTEWGQICIMDSLADYRPVDEKEAESIVEKVIPRLQHANNSVVLSAVKVLMVYFDYVRSSDVQNNAIKKMAPPLISLVSAEPELQYVALRNINLILQKRPDVLSQELRVFFCKYNDPPYVKLEKLEVLLKLASEKTVDQLLGELKEYSNEVDVGFVRKSVKAIGRVAIKIPSSAERCVNVLLDLIKGKVDYIVQEAIIVIKDIFRKYPNRYESIIPTLCENLESLDEPEAKASLVWIVGEYASRIENALELLTSLSEGFKEEDVQVQLALTTAVVKLLLVKPNGADALVKQVLQTATSQVENPDVRDRAFVYWRLLSSNPTAAKAIVLAEKPPIVAEDATVSDVLLDELIHNIGSIASVMHKSVKLIGSPGVHLDIQLKPQEGEEEFAAGGEPVANMVKEENLLDLDFDPNQSPTQPSAPASGTNPLDLLGDILAAPSAPAVASTGVNDLLSGLGSTSAPAVSSGIVNQLSSLSVSSTSAVAPSKPIDPLAGLVSLSANGSGFGSAFGQPSVSPVIPVKPYSLPKAVWVDAATAGKGMEVAGSFARRNGQVFLDLTITNKSSSPMSDFAIQLNKNIFGLVPAAPLSVPSPLTPSASTEVSVPLATTGPVQPMQPMTLLQMAIKNAVDVIYFSAMIPAHVMFVEDGKIETADFNDAELKSSTFVVNGVTGSVLSKLSANNIHITRTQGTSYQATGKTSNGILFLFDVSVSGSAANVTVKTKNPEYGAGIQNVMDGLLKA